MRFYFVLSFIFSALSSYAQVGGNGGGDECERRFKEIRDDLHVWLKLDHSKTLKLDGVSFEEYQRKMGFATSLGIVSIRCIDEEILVNGVPKTCRWSKRNQAFIDSIRNISPSSTLAHAEIECNTARFNSLTPGRSDTDENRALAIAQNRLVHHEYAAMLELESDPKTPNNTDLFGSNADSNYSISNQVADTVGPLLEWRLGWKNLSKKVWVEKTIEHEMDEDKKDWFIAKVSPVLLNQGVIYSQVQAESIGGASSPRNRYSFSFVTLQGNLDCKDKTNAIDYVPGYLGDGLGTFAYRELLRKMDLGVSLIGYTDADLLPNQPIGSRSLILKITRCAY